MGTINFVKDCGCKFLSSKRTKTEAGYHTKLSTIYCKKHSDQINKALEILSTEIGGTK